MDSGCNGQNAAPKCDRHTRRPLHLKKSLKESFRPSLPTVEINLVKVEKES